MSQSGAYAKPNPPAVRVLVVAPGPMVLGGITAAVRAHSLHPKWNQYSCTVLATCTDGSRFRKSLAAIRGVICAPGAMRRADIVHVHSAGYTSLTRKSVFFTFAKWMGKKTIVHLHAGNIDWLFGNWLVRTVAGWMLGSADRVIALTPAWAEVIRSRCPRARVEVIPNPVCNATSPAPRSRDSLKVLYLGRLDPKKGYRDLISAMRVVVDRIPNAKLVLAGNGEVDRARALVASLGMRSSVEFPGWVDSDRKARALEEAALLCLPSYAEGLPMAVLEAMEAGLPIVCTPVGGLPEVVREDKNGRFVKPGDIAGLAAVLVDLLSDSMSRERLGQCGRELVLSQYSLNQVWGRLSALYNELAEAAVSRPEPELPRVQSTGEAAP